MILFASALLNGLTLGFAVFLVAAGVTLIYGILRVLNFAHGSFFMIGAYVAFSFFGASAPSLLVFLGVAVVAGLVVGALGYVTDLTVLRRLRNLDEAMTLIATFALLLVCDGVVKLIWGLDYHTVSPPDLLSNTFMVGAIFVPTFSLFIIAVGILIFIVLDVLIHRVWFGKTVQAVAADQWMSDVLGLNVPFIFTVTVIIAFFLAGLAGGLLVPNQSLSPTLAQTFLLQAFVVVIIGGLGNIRGAFYASIILGLVDSLNTVLLPDLPGLAVYFVMVLFLLWRPQGLLTSGTQMAPAHAAASEQTPREAEFRVSAPVALTSLAALAAIILALPAWANRGVVFLAGLTLIDAVFALSWNLLFGFTGLAIFGHAAFFALGAYLVAFLLKTSSIPFLALLVAAGLTGAVVAAFVGFVALRRTTGIALAILTLALTQILQLVIGYSTALGSDDGISAIPRPVLDFGFAQINLRAGNNYYWFLCIACALIGAGLWWLTSSEFGRILLCIRQDADRAEFLGINVKRSRLVSFTISGAVAALAGALYAPWVQIVSPEVASYLRSTQPMLNTLLGGSEYFLGPAVGSLLFSALSYGTRTFAGVSDLISGCVLLLIVLAAPTGVLGILGRVAGRWPTGARPASRHVAGGDEASAP